MALLKYADISLQHGNRNKFFIFMYNFLKMTQDI